MAPHTIQIYIDSEAVTAHDRHSTGAAVLQLAHPTAQRLWRDLPDAPDREVSADQGLELEDGQRFFTDRIRTIFLDKLPYQVRSSALSEAELRALPTPPVSAELGLWRDVPDDLDDPLETDEVVLIADGDRFFTKPLPHHEIRIYVNGRPREVDRKRVTYEQIVSIAFPDGPAGPNVTHTVTYTGAAGPKSDGSLAAGGSVKVKEGTAFNVTSTDKS